MISKHLTCWLPLLQHYPVEHSCIASVLKNLGIVCKKLGQLDRAAVYYTRLVESMECSLGTNHPAVATALVNLGVVYSQLVCYSDALLSSVSDYQLYLIGYHHRVSPGIPSIIPTLVSLGSASCHNCSLIQKIATLHVGTSESSSGGGGKEAKRSLLWRVTACALLPSAQICTYKKIW